MKFVAHYQWLIVAVVGLCWFSSSSIIGASAEENVESMTCANNDTEACGGDGPPNFDEYLDEYYNEEFNANNMVEFTFDKTVVNEIYQDYLQDVKPHLHTRESTDDFCLVTPYNPKTSTWGSFAKEAKSDIKWYSVNNEATYQRYLNHVNKLGLLDQVRNLKWIKSNQLTVYSMFLIVRSFSKKHEFHLDWSEEIGTQVITALIPLKDFRINMAYKDLDGETQDYKYQPGKAVGVAGGLMHTTGKGKYEEEENDEDVLLCVYVGSDDKKIWKYALDNISDELEHYQNPVKQKFVRNKNLKKKKSKCQ